MSAERFFLDTAYVQALLSARDQYHRSAGALYPRVRAAREVWVTEAVLKVWGLTDCISFLVMQDQGLVDALTADEHFRQAGFRPLLCE